MIASDQVLAHAHARGFDFYSGVPCSFLTPLINRVIGDEATAYVGAASEGEAVGIAAGAWLAGPLNARRHHRRTSSPPASSPSSTLTCAWMFTPSQDHHAAPPSGRLHLDAAPPTDTAWRWSAGKKTRAHFYSIMCGPIMPGPSPCMWPVGPPFIRCVCIAPLTMISSSVSPSPSRSSTSGVRKYP